MDEDLVRKFGELLDSENLAKKTFESYRNRHKKILHLISQVFSYEDSEFLKGKMPKHGLDQTTIEYMIALLSSFDSNNSCGRSGDLNEVQPKAAGSSALYRLCNKLVLHAIKSCGITSAKSAVVLPVATGMALTLSFLSLKKMKPTAKYIIWLRIDQKSCFKSITACGFTPLIIEGEINGDLISTNLKLLEETMKLYEREEVLCVVSTTSCFAPRIPDNVVKIAKLCKVYGLFHVINNAYGLQDSKICSNINMACNDHFETSLVVQSTDKNFMVPVGGSIVFSQNPSYVENLSKNYPGRASLSPILDLTITLLEMGENGLKKLIFDRKNHYEYLFQKLKDYQCEFPDKIRILNTPGNGISIGIQLIGLDLKNNHVGSKLWYKGVSGARLIVNNENSLSIDGISFRNWGKHHDNYFLDYLTVAAAVGINKDEIDKFIKRLRKAV